MYQKLNFCCTRQFHDKVLHISGRQWRIICILGLFKRCLPFSHIRSSDLIDWLFRLCILACFLLSFPFAGRHGKDWSFYIQRQFSIISHILFLIVLILAFLCDLTYNILNKTTGEMAATHPLREDYNSVTKVVANLYQRQGGYFLFFIFRMDTINPAIAMIIINSS